MTTYKGKAIPVQGYTGPRVPEESACRISRRSAHEGGKVVNPTHRPHGHSAAVRIVSMKNSPMTPSGFEPATFRLVAHCLIQPHHSEMTTNFQNEHSPKTHSFLCETCVRQWPILKEDVGIQKATKLVRSSLWRHVTWWLVPDILRRNEVVSSARV